MKMIKANSIKIIVKVIMYRVRNIITKYSKAYSQASTSSLQIDNQQVRLSLLTNNLPYEVHIYL